ILGYVNVPVEGHAPYFDTSSWAATAEGPGLAWAEPQTIAADVRRLRESADQVIVILHSGYEYAQSPSPEQTASARAAIDAGASLVIGHHAHILQGVEFRGSGAIVYGLGNFAFNITGPPETVILNAWFDENGLRQLRFLPGVIQGTGQPRLSDPAEAAAIRRRIYALSAGLN
ncbi:MAG TPA: CapA family protein, partial [Candidatus Binatia bacterium]|nr:CapA family protein [Candidatus Binatia bacterium]